MRLLTHNMLACNIKGVTKGFPLGIEVTKLETKESAMNADFLRHIYPKLDWKALHDAAHTVRVLTVFVIVCCLQ
jgi:multifunctional methyltransferase subunit TRM112